MHACSRTGRHQRGRQGLDSAPVVVLRVLEAIPSFGAALGELPVSPDPLVSPCCGPWCRPAGESSRWPVRCGVQDGLGCGRDGADHTGQESSALGGTAGARSPQTVGHWRAVLDCTDPSLTLQMRQKSVMAVRSQKHCFQDDSGSSGSSCLPAISRSKRRDPWPCSRWSNSAFPRFCVYPLPSTPKGGGVPRGWRRRGILRLHELGRQDIDSH